MEISTKTGDWSQLRNDAQAVRYEVFVVEQGIPIELEWDEMDELSVHAVAYDSSGRAIGTARLLPDHHIGRMAVRAEARRHGVGGRLLQTLMTHARLRGAHSVLLNAQTYVVPFYQRHGFVAEGEAFEDAGIPHICMRHDFG